jgi:hypothetical protein
MAGTDCAPSTVSVSARTVHEPAALRDLGNVIRLIQQDAKRAGLHSMTEREINAEVEAARKEMRTKSR